MKNDRCKRLDALEKGKRRAWILWKLRMNRIVVCMVGVLAAGSIAAQDNTLTPREKKAGWILLFGGKTTRGWQTIQQQPLDSRYVQKGSLNPHPCEYMLIHEKQWDHFVLSLDLKISKGCNSGIFFRTFPLKPREGKDVGFNGLEIAIDDTRTAGFHDTGAIYDLVKPKRNAMKAVGSWNHMVLTCKGSHITVSVNGYKVTEMNLDQWIEKNRRPDGTVHKFDIAYKTHPRHGYIGLQDHGADCWYKNIKLLPLKD